MFFFFKQKTAYELRISDWSSDVCSSDLLGGHVRQVLLRLLRSGLRVSDRGGTVRATGNLAELEVDGQRLDGLEGLDVEGGDGDCLAVGARDVLVGDDREDAGVGKGDRKSTRLNSSH